jgi:hypothetical protein
MSRNSSIRLCAISDRMSWPLPRITTSLPCCCLSAATAAGTSPLSSIEFSHGSGSDSVDDATYLSRRFNASVYGLPSVWWGQ